MQQQEQEQKSTLGSLAKELKQKISQEETEKSEEDISKPKEKSKEDIKKTEEPLAKESEILDKQIQEASEKITEKEAEKEAKELKKTILKEDSSKKPLGVVGKETLIPLEDYIKCAVHLGTKVITPHMKKYVYKRRADGLAVINTVAIDEKLREAIDFLIKYEQGQIYLVCKREAGWPAAKKFQQVTGIKTFTKKYPPGITTNLELEDFFEAELTIICDPWIDRNALVDTARLKKPVISLCDTNNFTTHITKIIPCNNKAKKSIGCMLYILAREFCRAKDLPFNVTLEDFTGELE